MESSVPSPINTSSRLPAFPPHAVIKPPSPEIPTPALSDIPDQPDVDSTVEGLIWAPRLKSGDSEKIIRGKGDVRKYGWGHLPPQVIRLVLNHASTNLPIPPMIRKAWIHNPYCTEVVDALATRLRLISLRRVCSNWRLAVDQLPFWGRYIRLICPTYDYDRADAPAIAAHHANSRSSSNAIPFKGPTPFMRAFQLHDQICIACALTAPSRTTYYPSYRKADPVLLDGLCWIKVCDIHEESCCNSCGKAERPYRVSDGSVGVTAALCLSTAVEDEVNELDGYRTSDSQICRWCRQAALDSSILKQLRSCARSGGIIRGSGVNWSSFSDYNNYVLAGNITARAMAERLVSRWSLTTQGRYSELKSLAKDLQSKEYLMKWNYINGYEVESQQEKEERIIMIQNLSPYLSVGGYTSDLENMRNLKRVWDWDYKVHGRQIYEDMRNEIRDPGLNEKYTNILHEACINDFLVERFRIGIWVLPSFEADILSSFPKLPPGSPLTTSPITPLFSRLNHPFPSHPDILPLPNPSIPTGPALGIFHLGEYHLGVGPKLPGEAILPPSLTIQTMDERFIWWLRKTLSPAMRRLVEDIIETMGGREREAEEICDAMGLKEVLQALRGEEVWLNTKAAARRIGRLERYKKAGVVQEKMEEDVPVQPLSTSSTLGKRKTPPADLAQKDGEDAPVPNRPTRNSRESSVHRVSTSTSTSTPEDIVMPITPNDEGIESLRTFIAQVTGEENGKESAEDIAKMAKSLGITPGTGSEKRAEEGGMIVEETEEDEDLDGSSLASDVEVGRGVNGHYEEPYASDEEEEEEYEDEELEDCMEDGEGEDEFLADKRLREEKEAMDLKSKVQASGGGGGNGLYTPSTLSSSTFENTSSLLSSPESLGPPGLYPKEKEFHTYPFEIPFIPLPDSDDPSDPTMRLLCGEVIMRLWWDCRKGLRVCRCGICERGRAVTSVEQDIGGLIK